MIKGFETTPMFGTQLFGPQSFAAFSGAMPGADAIPQAMARWNQGMGEIARAMVDYSKQAFEDGAATYRQLATAKSLEEAYEIQTRYAQRAMEGYMRHAQNVGALYMRLAQTSAMPQSLTFPRV